MVKKYYEYCQNCDSEEVELIHDIEKDGYEVKCPNCGEVIMLCNACLHADDNPDHFCDRNGECFRTRGINAKEAMQMGA